MNDSLELDDLFEFDEEGFDDVDLNLKGGVVDSEFSELHEDGFEMDSDLSVKFLVSGFLDSDVNSDGDTQSFFFDDFVDVFQDFDNLWHDDDLFDDLFEDVWDFNDLFDSAVDWNDSFFVSVNDLKLSFNLVSDIGLEDEVVLLDDFVLVDDDFLDFSDVLFDGNDLFFDQWNLDDFLLDNWNFDNLFLDGFDDLVDLDDDWVVDWQLNDLRDLDDLFIEFLNLVDSWDFVSDSDDLFDDVWNLDNLLDG